MFRIQETTKVHYVIMTVPGAVDYGQKRWWPIFSVSNSGRVAYFLSIKKWQSGIFSQYQIVAEWPIFSVSNSRRVAYFLSIK